MIDAVLAYFSCYFEYLLQNCGKRLSLHITCTKQSFPKYSDKRLKEKTLGYAYKSLREVGFLCYQVLFLSTKLLFHDALIYVPHMDSTEGITEVCNAKGRVTHCPYSPFPPYV